MSDHAYATWLTQAELQTLLTAPPAAFDWMILEAVDELVFDSFRGAIDLARFDAGRVFGQYCELRWQRDGQMFHALLVGAAPQPPASFIMHHQELADDSFDYVDGAYFLWGEWSQQTPIWVEAMIPHIFNYPPPPQQTGRWRRQVKTVEYVNRSTGETEFYRFTEIIPFEVMT